MTDQPTDARRIAAVVVTFNRLGLLQRLVARLREVPEVDEILVVDNASTDGTGEWLRSTGTADTAGAPVLGRTLPENRGGAGGFHDGLGVGDGPRRRPGLADGRRRAARRRAASTTLLARREELDFWGPVVVDEAAPGRLVFPIRLPGGTRVVHAMADVAAAAGDGLIRDVVIPFNGVLVTRELVERIGLPREEFFIWGDDHEYRLRAEEAGARIATVVDARVRHPSVGELGTPMMFGRTTYNHSPSDLKHYCMARNNLLNLRDYRGWPHALVFVAKTALVLHLHPARPGGSGSAPARCCAGLRGDFTGHRRFLR